MGSDMLALTDLLERVRGYNAQADLELIEKAYRYSKRMHDGQARKSGDPYFIHPASVSGIIAEMRLDTASVCAALLHDVVEDTDVTEKDIEQQFGEEVSFLVDGVTKLGKVNFHSKEDRQAESFRKMLVAMARDIRVLLVKLADRLDNMRTLEHMKIDSQERIATETMEIYAPLAGRLGIQWLKAELEDLSFRYLHPDAAAELDRQIEASQKDTDRYITDVCKHLKKMLIARGFAMQVSGRRKHAYSIYRKMKRQHIEFEQVHDLVAFRVMMETVADCYAALGVIHSEWTPVPGRFKDYIALPKAEHVPVAAHDGDRPGQQAHRGPDPHPRDAPHRRARHRGALAIQAGPGRIGSPGRRAFRLAATAHGVPSGTSPTPPSSWSR